MDFKGNYRIEAVYFEKLKRDITEAKRLIDAGASGDARVLLENAVDVDGAVLLLYRNLGELWAELADKLEQARKELQALDEKTEQYHDELNEKIDEINNYLMAIIRELDARLEVVEEDLATMQRVKIYHIVYDTITDIYWVKYNDQMILFDDFIEDVEKNFVVLYDESTLKMYYPVDLNREYGPISGAVNFREIPFGALSGLYLCSVSISSGSIDDIPFTRVHLFENFEDSLRKRSSLTFTSLTTAICDTTEEFIIQDFYQGYSTQFISELNGADILFTVHNVTVVDSEPMPLIDIKAFAISPDGDSIYLASHTFTDNPAEYTITQIPVPFVSNRLPETYTVVFSALSSGASMIRLETNEVLTFADVADACLSGKYNVRGVAQENWAGQTGNPVTYAFSVEMAKNNDGFGNNFVMFQGWKGSATAHGFLVEESGVTYDTILFETV